MQLLSDEAQKQAALDRMRRIAGALLLGAALVFVVARVLEVRYAWLWVGFVRATAEAAMVGAIADWFAVTALFRYPLGIRIPHTAIVPTRKDRIGGSLGRFVEHNFLSREVLGAKVESMHVAERMAAWLQKPESAERLAGHAAAALGALLRSLDDAEMERLITGQLEKRVRDTEATPLLGDALGFLLAGPRRRELLDGTLALIQRLLEENRGQLRERIEREIPWWIPAPIDEKIYRKIIDGTEDALRDVRARPDHPFRDRFDELVSTFVARLKSSPEMIAKGEALKQDLLDGPVLQGFAHRLWGDIEHSLLPPGDHGAEGLREPLERALVALGQALARDDRLLRRVDHWAEEAVLAAAEEYRHEVAHLIATTVAAWDPEDTSRKIELQVGRDLQFIRINGTVVGGLVGLLIYTLSLLL